MRLLPALATLASAHAAPFSLHLIHTGEVQGAVFPVNRFGTQCTGDEYAADPCDCYGGVARRRTAVDALRAQHNGSILLDTGAYAFGGGTFFAGFHGAASAEFFGQAGYDAWALNYRDIALFGNGSWFAAYVAQARRFHPALPPAVVSNLNLTADALDGAGLLVRHHTLPLAGGRRLAFLALSSADDVLAVNANYGARHTEYVSALLRALAELRRAPEGEPDVVVCSVFEIPTPTPSALAAAGGDVTLARRQLFDEIVREAVGVDIFLQRDVVEHSHFRTNVAGDTVFVAGQRDAHGTHVAHLHASFDGAALLTGLQETIVPLDCSVGSHAPTEARMLELNAELQARLGRVTGYAARAVDGRRGAPGNCTIQLPFDSRAETGDATSDGTAACGCRVAECAAGNLVADALRWYGGSDVAITNGGGIRDSLPAGAVSGAHVLSMLPFLNTLHVFPALPGAALRAALQHSLSAVHYAFSGRYLQVSSSLRFEWHFDAKGVARLGAVYVRRANASAFALLDDAALYSVGAPSYLAGGGDGYAMLAAHASTPRGLPEYTIVTYFLQAEASVPPGLTAAREGRIVQTASIVRLELGLLCTVRRGEPNATARERCDHAHQMVAAVNDKADGLFDALLPDAFIVAAERTVDCDAPPAALHAAQRELWRELPRLSAVIGPACAAHVAALSGGNASAYGGRALLLAPEAADVWLRDAAAYPNVVRVTSSETYYILATLEVMAGFAWRRVAIISDDSRWANSTADAFAAAFLRRGGEVIASASFAAAQMLSGALRPEAILSRLAAAGAKIVYVCAAPQLERRLLAASAASGVLRGAGYAWISASHDDAMVRFPNGTADAAALAAAEGLLYFAEAADEASPLYRAYAASYAAAAAARGGGCTAAGGEGRCDADGEPSTFPPHAVAYADAALLYAAAMDRVYRIAPHEWAPLHEAVLSLPPLPAPSGSLRLDADGDRVGDFALLNFQQADGGGAVGAARVGHFSSAGRLSFTAAVRFAGNRRQPPLDVDLSVVGCGEGEELIGEACTPCLAGTFKSAAGTHRCAPCPPGSAAPAAGAAACAPCAPGTAQPAGGGTACEACAPGRVQPAGGGTACEACEAGQYMVSHGGTACEACAPQTHQPRRGEFSCEACELNTNSTRGAAACEACAAGTYRTSREEVASRATCRPCGGARQAFSCPPDTTLASVQLHSGYWRHAANTSQIWHCKWGEGWTPCRGGGEAGEEGDGYCAEEHFGLRCERCRGAEAERYFNKADVRCHDCPDSTVPLLVALVVLCVVIALIHLVTQLLRHPPHNLRDASEKLKYFVDAVHAVGPSKMKSAVTFYQIILSLPVTFDLLPLEVDFSSMVDVFSFIEIDWSEAVYPQGCLVGGYTERLYIVALAPFVLMVFLPIVAVCVVVVIAFLHALLKASTDPRGSVRRLSTSARNSQTAVGYIRRLSAHEATGISQAIGEQMDLFVFGQESRETAECDGRPTDARAERSERSERSTRKSGSSRLVSAAGTRSMQRASKVSAKMVKALPLVLLVIFVMLPSVSRSIFSVWDCESVERGPNSTVAYMKRDVSVLCGGEEHQRTATVGVAFIIVWPVSMQLLFVCALWFNRRALRSGLVTPHTRATRFLTGGYKKEYFFWETIELFRRLVCSGFVILIPQEFIFMRIALCLVVSLPILVFTSVLQPFKNPEDTVLAVTSQAILVFAFSCCGLLRVVNSRYLTEEDKIALVGFTDPTGIFLVLGFCFVVFLLLVLGTYIYKINLEFEHRVRKHANPSDAASRWTVGGALIFGMMALLIAGAFYGLIASIVMSTTFFLIGAAVGSVAYSRCFRGSTHIKVKRYPRQAAAGNVIEVRAVHAPTRSPSLAPPKKATWSLNVEQATCDVADAPLTM